MTEKLKKIMSQLTSMWLGISRSGISRSGISRTPLNVSRGKLLEYSTFQINQDKFPYKKLQHWLVWKLIRTKTLSTESPKQIMYYSNLSSLMSLYTTNCSINGLKGLLPTLYVKAVDVIILILYQPK